MGRGSAALLACCLLAASGITNAFPWCKAMADRRRLQDAAPEDSAPPSILTDGNWTIVFQQVSSTRGATVNLLPAPKKVPFSVSNISATMEMSSNATFAANFDSDNRTTWGLGFTRVNVTVELKPQAVETLPANVTIRVHTIPCNFLSAVRYDDSNVYWHIPGRQETAMETAMPVIDATAFGSALFPYQIDYDKALSVGVYSGGALSGTDQPLAPLACANLIPPFPTFPNTWSATIEANIVDKGYTFVMREYYSQEANMVRLDMHSQATERVVIQNFNTQMWTLLTKANETYPRGVCETFPMDNQPGLLNRMYDNTNSAVLSTSQFLHFAGAVDGFIPGRDNIRGIPCERWGQSMAFSDVNATFDVSYYFPVNQWHVAREDYHRMLKRIRVNGTRQGYALDHYYEFVNMRPRELDPDVFDTCAIAPKGHNCGCTGAAKDATDLDGAVIDPNLDEEVESQTEEVEHFSPAQKVPYVVLFFSGLAAGVLLTTLAFGVYFLVSSRAKERLSHVAFDAGK